MNQLNYQAPKELFLINSVDINLSPKEPYKLYKAYYVTEMNMEYIYRIYDHSTMKYVYFEFTPNQIEDNTRFKNLIESGKYVKKIFEDKFEASKIMLESWT